MQSGKSTVSALLLILPLLMAFFIDLAPTAVSIQTRLHDFQEMSPDDGQFQREAAALQQLEPWRADLWRIPAEADWEAGIDCRAAAEFTELAALIRLTDLEQIHYADALSGCGLVEDANAEWMEFLSMADLTADSFSIAYSILLSESEVELAEDLLPIWVERFPQDASGWLNYGIAIAVVDPENARDHLMRAFSLAPELESSWTDLYTALDLNNEEQAAYHLVRIGQALAANGEWDLAQSAFEEALHIEPYYADAWALVGTALQQNGEDGYAALANARLLAPRSPFVLSAFADYWQLVGRLDLALAYINGLIALDAENPLWLVEKGALLIAMEDPQGALRSYVQAVDLAPNDEQSVLALAEFSIEYQIDIRGIGLPAARRAVVLSSGSAQAYDLLGQAYALLEDADLARRFFAESLQIHGDYAPAMLHLAIIDFEAGRESAAYGLLWGACNQSIYPVTSVQACRLLDQYFGAP